MILVPYKLIEYEILLIIFIVTTLLILLADYISKKKSFDDKSTVLIKQDDSPLKAKVRRITNLLSIPFFGLLVLSYFTNFQHTPLVILMGFTLMILSLYSKTYGDFLVTKNGFTQPEIGRKSYNWDEIEDINLTSTLLRFNLEQRDYSITISEEQFEDLKNLIPR